MRIPGLKTARKAGRWLRGRVTGGTLILGYHRISPQMGDAYDVRISPDHFAEHLACINRYYRPISMTALVHALKQGSAPRQAVAITFDDGYLDNLVYARPLLENYAIPATVFVTTGSLGETFWWDDLEWIVSTPPGLPDALEITIGGERFSWRNEPAGLRAQGASLPLVRKDLLRSLYAKLEPLGSDRRADVLGQLADWAGTPVEKTGPKRAMNSSELLDLTASGLIELGAHTVTHPVLPDLALDLQREEILASKTCLEERTGKPVPGFAYPHGLFTAETQAIVQQAGFQFACSSFNDLARTDRQRYALPRFWPHDWSGERMERFLRRWHGR